MDAKGNVVGMVVSKLSDMAGLAATGSVPQNVNYALKSSCILSFLESVPDLKRPAANNAVGKEQSDLIVGVGRTTAIVMVCQQ